MMIFPADIETLPELVDWCGDRYGDRLALTRPDEPNAKGLTFRQLADTVHAGATRLAKTMPQPRARVMLVAGAGPDWLSAFLAIGRAGMVCLPVPPETPPDVIQRLMGHVNARLVLADERIFSGEDQLAGRPIFRLVDLLLRGSGTPPPLETSPHDIALLVFTSGSTDRPRAVALTHGNLLWNIHALLRSERATTDDVFLSLLPPAHLFELVVGQLAPLACGSKIVYGGPPLPNRILASMRSHRVTRALVVPALLDALYCEVVHLLVEGKAIGPTREEQTVAAIANHLQTGATDEQLEALRRAVREQIGDAFGMLIVGGAAIDPAWSALCAALDLELNVGYGLTEAGPVVSQGRARACPYGSVGRPLSGVDVRIDAGGEIIVRSPAVMRGYVQDEQATNEVLRDGWLRTGDRGRLDDDGFLFVTGRSKEAIVTEAGATVYPEEIEPYYVDPIFAEHCVIPLPGPHGNDVPALIVVPSSASVTDEQICATFRHLRAVAPPRCRVARVQRADGPLLRTATGKIRRRAMADSLSNRKVDDDAS